MVNARLAGGEGDWDLTCERDGKVVTRQEVVIDRGETRRLDLGGCTDGA